MVDKENQWNDELEYSQNQDDYEQDGDYDNYDSADDDYSEQGDENYEYDDEEEFENGEDSSNGKNKNQLILIIIALLLFGLAGFIFMSKSHTNNQAMQNINSNSEEISFEQSDANGEDMDISVSDSSSESDDGFFNDGESSDMVSIDFNENGSAQVSDNSHENAKTANVTDSDSALSGNDLFESSSSDLTTDASKENNDIIISYDKPVRENPFKPPILEEVKVEKPKNLVANTTPFEIIEPPTTSIPDPNVTKLLSTQISGILYDDVSPSAIINLNGVDTFVKIGDMISGYKIQDITRDKVQINYKNNSYVASVGQLFVRGQLEKTRAVANLEQKFAGRYKDNN